MLAKESGPDVGFEADVYWVAAGGADPVALMKKYAGRMWFTHLKDMAKGVAPSSEAGAPRGVEGRPRHRPDGHQGHPGRRPQAGVELHFIEDESADPVGQIPKSVAYYKAL